MAAGVLTLVVASAADAAGVAQRAAKEGRQLLLVNLFRLKQGSGPYGLLGAYRTDLRGFTIGWIIGAGLIALVWLLFRL